MNFGLSDEQRLLEASLARFLAERLPIARVRELMEQEDAHDAAAWRALAELGVAGCLVPEEHGGAGLALLDAAVIATALGHAAAPTPFLASAVIAPLALRLAGSEAQQRAWLPRVANGSARFGVALAEAVEVRRGAGVRADGTKLSGAALFAEGAVGADAILVAAGDDLWLVSPDAPGLTLTPLPTIDRTRRFVDLAFAGVPAERLGAPAAGGAALPRILDAARVVLAADLLGCCDRALSLSVAYAMQRKQFDRPIASFQAVKHMCAEMAAAIEPARSLVWYAAHAFDAIPAEASLAATLAKAHLAEVAHEVVRTATQVHGGIGFTDECDVQIWFKRAGVGRQLLGGPALLRARAAELQSL